MFGALIGDLATWTWQNNKDFFYRQLMAEEATLSEYGATILGASKLICNGEDVTPENIRIYLLPYLQEAKGVSDAIVYWLKSGNKLMPFNGTTLIVNIMNTLIGWNATTLEEGSEYARKVACNFILEKEDFYAAMILPKLVWCLRQGMTKDESLQKLADISHLVKEWRTVQEDTPLTAIARAWDAFYRAFDFTSTIHSAVKSPINPRLTAAIAGELAEAMYGCEMGFLKKKYSDNFSFNIQFPGVFKKRYEDELAFLNSKKQVLFFPKNSALTNVEIHKWTAVDSHYSGMEMNEKHYQELKRAFYTDFDYRFGLYLDNGWFYVYRSYFLLGRFKVKTKSSGLYFIDNVQMSDDKKGIDLDEALYNAFSGVRHNNMYG